MVQEVEVTPSKHETVLYVEPYLMDIKEQLDIYRDTIQPLIINIEQMSLRFPVEILNEIRALYTHLSSAFSAEDANGVISNIEKMKRHTKRAVLDCFKNSCIILLIKEMIFLKNIKGLIFHILTMEFS